MLRKTVTTLVVAAAVAAPAGNVWAAIHAPKIVAKKKVETLTITGPRAPCGPKNKWGDLQVRIKVQKTTTTVRGKPKVTIKILALDFPVVSNTTDKTVYINKKALPILQEDVLTLQTANIESISGATDTWNSFRQSLQAALIQAKKP
ncbi:MAG TPA: hypothetical protein VH721_03520 [Gaiellaceae bacterium]